MLTKEKGIGFVKRTASRIGFGLRVGSGTVARAAIHVVSASGVSVDLEKVETVMSWERPKSIFKKRNFLGLAGYYRRFIEDFSRLAAPMKRLTQKEVKFEWNNSCEKAFQKLKRRLTSTPIMIVPKRG